MPEPERREEALNRRAAGEGPSWCLLPKLGEGPASWLLLPAFLLGRRSSRLVILLGSIARSRSSRRSSSALGRRGSSRFRNRLRLFRTRRMNRNHRWVTPTSQPRNRHALGQRQIRKELGLVEAHARQIEL